MPPILATLSQHNRHLNTKTTAFGAFSKKPSFLQSGNEKDTPTKSESLDSPIAAIQDLSLSNTNISNSKSFPAKTPTINLPSKQQVREQQVSPSVTLTDQSNCFPVREILYTAVKPIGRGGQASVYLVHQKCTAKGEELPNTAYALKVANFSKAADPVEALNNIKDEINILQSFKDTPRVVKIKDWEVGDDGVFIVMEYATSDLTKMIASDSFRAPSKRLHFAQWLFWNLLMCIKAVHKGQYIHGDLKPANFLVFSNAGNISLKIADFGIAKKMVDNATYANRDSLAGTMSYIAPELLLEGSKAHRSSDIWAIGCIMYQFLYCRPPTAEFLPKNYSQQALKLYAEQVNNPKLEFPFDQNEDPALVDLVRKCLSINSKARPTVDQILSHPFFGEIFIRPPFSVSPPITAPDYYILSAKKEIVNFIKNLELASLELDIENIDNFVKNIAHRMDLNSWPLDTPLSVILNGEAFKELKFKNL